MEGGASAVEDIMMFATSRLTPRMTPGILHYLSQFPCTPTWAPDPVMGLVQHYYSLQGLNRCIASLIMLKVALVHPLVVLLASSALGRLLVAWEPQFPLCRYTCSFTYTPGEVFTTWAYLLGCWAQRALCTGVLVATYDVLAIAQRNRLLGFIIIVQTLDDVTLQSSVAIIIPLTPKLGVPFALPHHTVPLYHQHVDAVNFAAPSQRPASPSSRSAALSSEIPPHCCPVHSLSVPGGRSAIGFTLFPPACRSAWHRSHFPPGLPCLR